MAKTPAIVKWFFAIVAFVSGSIVAQLLQPPPGKTESIGSVALTSQLEAALTELSLGANDQTVVRLSRKTSSNSPQVVTTADAEVRLGAASMIAPKLGVVTPPSKLSDESARAYQSTSVSSALKETEGTDKYATKPGPQDLKPIAEEDQAPQAPIAMVLTNEPAKNPVLRTASRSHSTVSQSELQQVQAEKLSLTDLPILSSEAEDFKNIRHSLPGQFEPLKGIPHPAQSSTTKKLTVTKLSPTPFSSSTALPTEIFPASKPKPQAAADVVESSTSQPARARRVAAQKVLLKALNGSESVESAVNTDSAAAPQYESTASKSQTTAIPKIAEARIAIDKDTQKTVANTVKAVAKNETPSPLSPELVALRTKLERVIKMYREQEISVREKSAWSVMHSFIGYGVDKKVRIDHQGNRASAIGWICFNNPCRGVRLFYLKNGEIYGRLGPGNQGHEGQFLAMLAQSRVHADYPMKIEGRDFTVLDLVEREKRSCRPKTELTFKLIGLSHYLESDEKWRDDRGSEWNIPRLLKEEMQQPIIGAACGGTHRLFGLSYAINRRIHKGNPVDGQYRRAEIYIKDYQKYTFKMQNPDGSFSTRFFSGRGAANDLDRRLLTTGHISEWLAFSLERNELTEPRMVHAMDYLAGLLLRGKYPGWKVGPLGHALHAVNIYNDRVFKHNVNTPVVAARPR